MASTPKQQIAAPQIFNSDPVEQIFAKGTLDPEMGGIAYAFLNSARNQRADSQGVYMANLQASNRLASALAQEEMRQEMLREALKQGPDYAKAGINFNDIPALAAITQGGTGALTGESPELYRDLLMADAAAKRASAANAGAAGGPKMEVELDTDPNGPGAATFKAKGGSIQDIMRAQAELAAWEKKQRGPGGAWERKSRSELLTGRKDEAYANRRGLQNERK